MPLQRGVSLIVLNCTTLTSPSAPIPVARWLVSLWVFSSRGWPGRQFTGDQIKFNGKVCVRSRSRLQR